MGTGDILLLHTDGLAEHRRTATEHSGPRGHTVHAKSAIGAAI
jgi:hypothetical protein